MKLQFEQFKEIYGAPIPEKMQIDEDEPAEEPSTSNKKSKDEPKKFVPSVIENELDDVDTSALEKPMVVADETGDDEEVDEGLP